MRDQTSARTVECVVAILAACLFARQAVADIAHPIQWFAYAVPIFTALALRFSICGALQMASVFSAFVLTGIGDVASSWMEQIQLALCAVATFAATLRFQSARDFAYSSAIRSHLDFRPLARSIPQQSLGGGHFFSIGFWIGSWLFAGFLCSHFTILTGNRRLYGEYRRLIDIQIGLIPEWYIGMKLLLSLGLLLGAARFILAYMRLQQPHTNESALLLRSELWNWDGRDQRRVARARRKQRFTDGRVDQSDSQ